MALTSTVLYHVKGIVTDKIFADTIFSIPDPSWNKGVSVFLYKTDDELLAACQLWKAVAESNIISA
jgi:hypothetical protein